MVEYQKPMFYSMANLYEAILTFFRNEQCQADPVEPITQQFVLHHLQEPMS
jgi:hypothetical protein